MPNRLQAETSPYLQQHAENPVDWYPWGPEALAEAKRRDRPIFLSIGYAACHWCHVMAHESFEDAQIARTLNEHFVPVKVDREERPDLDQLYMEAVQLMTGRGGWPLSVFLTPSLEPFFGGTYWPPRARAGMPGFDRVLRAVAEVWEHRRQEAMQQAERLTAVLRDDGLTDMVAAGALDDPLLQAAESELVRAADPQHGGFGAAPKFPQPVQLRFLLRRWRRTGRADLLAAVTTTLDHMAAGGIYDHLGGGFHRYATDAQWLVPHFEKMLYDNALLAACYLEAWQATQHADYARVVRETLDYVLRDMTDPGGGFYSSEDADSEGEEGKFYLWTPDELRSVLGPQAATAWASVYDVSTAGNFEGANILHRAKPVAQCAELLGRDAADLEAELAESRGKLFDARNRRVRPGRDTKVLVDWNGLAIDALAQAGRALRQPRYLQAARTAADFLLANLRGPNGGLLHCWSGGQARFAACLADYASLANALVSLYEATFQERYVDEALRLADTILAEFTDRQSGVLYTVGAGHEPLIARKTDLLDSSIPSGGGLATTALLRLGKLCGRADYLAAAEAALRTASPLMERAPMGTGQLLLALDMHLGPTPEIVLLGNGDHAAATERLDELFRGFLPSRIVAFREPSGSGRSPALDGIFADKGPLAPGPTLFLCERFTCQSPVSGAEPVRAALESLLQGER